MKALRALAAALLAIYLMSGLYFVQPDEQGIVRRFGAVSGRPREPGSHLGLPWGLDRLDRVKAREVKRVVISPRSVPGGATGGEGTQFLTGDRNLVNVEATVQYTISAPDRYLFSVVSVDDVVSRAARAVLAEMLTVESVDRVLTEGKRELAMAAARRLEEIVDSYGLGIVIRSLDISTIEPPPEVVDAFASVISALRQREQKIHEADGFSRQILARAAGEAQEELDRAEVYRDRLVNAARGDAKRFEALLAEYRHAPGLTALRLYAEAMAEVLPRFRSKLIVDPRSELDLSVIPERGSTTKEGE